MEAGGSSSTGLPFPLLKTPGVGGELCAKHHCFTRASCNSDEGSSVISGDIGPVGDDRLCFGVDDEDDEAEVLAEELSEGGIGEATLGGVDRGEERGDANMGIPSLKMGAETSILPRSALITIRQNMGVLTFQFRLRVKRKWLGDFLQTARAAPWRGWSLDWRSNPELRGDLLGNLREIDSSRDTASHSQRRYRSLAGLFGKCDPPQAGRRRGVRKGRWAWKYRGELWEGKNAGIDRKAGGNGSRLHRAWSGKRPILGGRAGRGRRSFEGDAVVHAIVIVPPFADTRGSEPPNKVDVVLSKLLLVKLEVDDKAETIPLGRLRTTLAISKLSNRVTDSPRSGEGRREMSERVGVLAQDLRGCLPVIEGKPEGDLLLKSNVADKNRSVESSWPRLGK